MRRRLTAVMSKVVRQRLGSIFLSGRGCRFDVHPQLVVVLDVETTAVEGMSAVRCAHNRIGGGDGGGPRIGANLFVGDHSFDLDNSTVRCALQEQVDPPWPAQ